MLLRSSSTPALKNLVGQCSVVPEIDAASTPSHVSPKYSPLRQVPPALSLKRTSSEGDLKLFSSKKGKSKKQIKDGTSPLQAPLQRTSSEGDLKLRGISSLEEASRSVVAALESAGGPGGRGEGGFSGGRGGDGEDGIWGELPPQGTESMDKYYRDMITMYPGDALLLSNYAKFLKEARGDAARAEEFCERAILVSGGDGGVLSMYGDLIWNNHRDGGRANTYFNQAVKSSPDDCHVIASYARFLWDVAEEGEEEEEEEDEEVEEEQAQQFQPRRMPQAHQPAHRFSIGFGTQLGFPPLTASTT
ncbi:unnamed protein product [Linum tenue]|uniref:Uncharacterized protein n=1 Tax=Linum tenue TaxID=586396 RepID=A0AAV0JZZ5_9ROSI|nr:unnamed protein product [Linum tenue]